MHQLLNTYTGGEEVGSMRRRIVPTIRAVIHHRVDPNGMCPPKPAGYPQIRIEAGLPIEVEVDGLSTRLHNAIQLRIGGLKKAWRPGQLVHSIGVEGKVLINRKSVEIG